MTVIFKCAKNDSTQTTLSIRKKLIKKYVIKTATLFEKEFCTLEMDYFIVSVHCY